MSDGLPGEVSEVDLTNLGRGKCSACGHVMFSIASAIDHLVEVHGEKLDRIFVEKPERDAEKGEG
jgi:hypothetical protein